MGDWHMCEGAIDVEAYIGIVQIHIHGKYMLVRSRQCQVSFCMQQQCGFVDTE